MIDWRECVLRDDRQHLWFPPSWHGDYADRIAAASGAERCERCGCWMIRR